MDTSTENFYVQLALLKRRKEVLKKVIRGGCGLVLLGTVSLCASIGCGIFEGSDEESLQIVKLSLAVFGVIFFVTGVLVCYITSKHLKNLEYSCRQSASRMVPNINIVSSSEIQNSVGLLILQNPPPEGYFESDFYKEPPSYEELFVKTSDVEAARDQPPCYDESDHATLHL